jgi:hypothetical protein
VGQHTRCNWARTTLSIAYHDLEWGQRAVYPARWRLMGRESTYDWVGADGVGE